MRASEAIRHAARILCLVSLLALDACASAALRAPLANRAEDSSQAPETIRTLRADQQFVELPIASVAQRAREMRPAQPFNILALSGGGADGAFGAGALIGLAQAGTRPAFAVVTGVSAGALIAPYAFLGPEWDQQLADAYTSGRAEHLLQPFGLGVVFGSSAYRGSPLKHLVEHYLTDALVQAVAREAASGRLLLVATTNVDTGETVIWDLGSIAMNGGQHAKALLRDVLVASASVPGLFPPVIIRVQERGRLFAEAHVDGTATTPFLVPASLAQQPGGLDASRLYRRLCHRRRTIERRATTRRAAVQGHSVAKHFCRPDAHDANQSRTDRNQHRDPRGAFRIRGDSHGLRKCHTV